MKTNFGAFDDRFGNLGGPNMYDPGDEIDDDEYDHGDGDFEDDPLGGTTQWPDFSDGPLDEEDEDDYDDDEF